MDFGCKRVVELTTKEHDAIIAYTSNLPHIMAVALVNSDSMHANTKYFIAGSFRDATRVADINAELWKDLFLFNKANVRAEIAKLQVQLNKWDKALADNDEQTLVTMMKEAKSKREDLFNAKISVELGANTYDITIEKGLRHSLAQQLRQMTKATKVAIITDTRVARLHGAELTDQLTRKGFEVVTIAIEAGEASKNLATLAEVLWPAG